MSRRASVPFDLVHTDVVGPVKITSIGGNSYFLLFTDDCSRYSWIYFMQRKSEVFQLFKQFKKMMETQFSRSVKALRTDSEGEFTSHEFESFCKTTGLFHQLTAPRTPQQNGVAERKNRTVTEMARTMMHAKKLPQKYWAEAVSTAVYLLNPTPTRALDSQTPYEALTGSRPCVDHIKTFGCLVYRYIDSQQRVKFDSKSRAGVFLGYCDRSKAYKVIEPGSHRVHISKDLHFFENKSWDWLKLAHSDASVCEPAHDRDNFSTDIDLLTGEDDTAPVRFCKLKNIHSSCLFALTTADPIIYEDAVKDPDWVKAMNEEI